ncbi:MAG TPA: MDR family MFS transporter [Micromonosporaceae bacterium]
MTTTAEPATPVLTPRYTHRQILEIIAALLMAMLTSMIATSVVGTALPTIVGELGGQNELSWVASATLLTMTASTPLWGKLSDLYGRKLLFQFSLVLFIVASVAAGFSQNMGELIAARAVQGIGAGGLGALTQVILGDVVEPRERGRYSGYLGAAFGVSTVAGPLLGGFIVDASWLGWRWCFWVSVPLAVVAFVMVQKILKLTHVRRKTRVDWLGATFLTAGSAALMLVLSLGGQEFAWRSGWTYGLLTVSLLMFVLAVWAERHAVDPILPPRLFRDRTFVLTSLAGLLVGVALYGGIIYMPQYLQIVKSLSPTRSGLMMLPLVVGMFIASVTTGRVVTRTGRWKAFPVIGLLVVAAGLATLSRLHVGSTLWLVGTGLAILGVGLGMTMQVLILAAQNAVTRHDMAAATSGVSYFRSLGGAVGVAAFGAILTNRASSEIIRLARRNHLPTGHGGSLNNLGTPDAIHHLPAAFQQIILEGFDRALQAVFLAAVPAALLAFVAVLLLKELPLRSARRNDQTAVAETPQV